MNGDTTERVLRAQLLLSPGSKPLCHTGDGTWKTAQGPITFDSVYDGETYDSTRATISDDAWKQAVVLDSEAAPRGTMIPWAAPPVTIQKNIPALTLTQPVPNIYVYDFGVNVAGVVRLNDVAGCQKGDTIVLRHGEIMQHVGLPDLGTSSFLFFFFLNNFFCETFSQIRLN